jgi:hypothetical protein
MNYWIIKNIRFGYKYNSDKLIRNNILKTSEWIINIIKSKSKNNDVLIIVGSIFSNTNPTLIAIDDANIFLNEISKYIKVYLVNTIKDVRIYDEIEYSTLDLFENINNLTLVKDIININNLTIIPYSKSYKCNNFLDVNINKINDIDIPNIIQLEKEENDSEIIVFNNNMKHIIIENNNIPKHLEYIINDINELKILSEENNNNYIHLKINKNILNDKELNILLFKLKPLSIKYFDDIDDNQKKEELLFNNSSLKTVIYDYIKNKENLIQLFDKVIKISEN